MATYIALLRAVNVGGRATVSMAELRSQLESSGHFEEVRTYIQSGNVVFISPRRPRARLERNVEGEVLAVSGVDTRVIVRTPAELREVVGANPFLMKGSPTAPLHVLFLKEPPRGKVDLDADRYAPDEFSVRGRDVYLNYVTGAGRTKLTTAIIERAVGTVGTARNWNTVNKLIEIAGPTH